jgi:hypothetical protein
MICTSCGKVAPPDQFTKVNRSADGTKALCRECKAEVDTEYYRRKNDRDKELAYFELKPDQLARPKRKARVGVLVLKNHYERFTDKNRTYFDKPNHGMTAILGELNEPYEFIGPELVNQYEYVLISLNSVMDVENLIYTFERCAPEVVTAKIVVGGFGVCNIKLIRDYIDIAVFGRAEGQINDILAGYRAPNVWCKEDDPGIEGRYVFRRPRYLVPGEMAVGCRNRCAYCQYTWIRPQLNPGEMYRAGMTMTATEADWNGLTVDKPGKYKTAWDGWSEATRFKVRKPVTDEDIRSKLIEIGNAGFDKTVFLDVYNIVGYPRETVETTDADLTRVGQMLQDIDEQITGKITIRFICTPFDPEPMTPMQYEPANIETNWRYLCNRTVFEGPHINAYIGAMIPGPSVLMKRVLLHRSETDGIELFKQIAFNGKLNRMLEEHKVPFLLKHGYIDPGMFGRVERAAFDYLSVESEDDAALCGLTEPGRGNQILKA